MSTEFGKRLKQARMHAGMTQVAASQATGISQSTISTAEREGYSSTDTAVYAKTYGVDAHWLATGEGSMVAADESNETGVLGDADILRVPLLANSGSMGPGDDEMADDVIVGSLALSADWVQRHVRPSAIGALRFIHGYGDSMAPTFQDGDVLLVDTQQRDPGSIDGVYVLRAHGRLFVKRVRRNLGGQLEVSSDNPTVKTVDILDGGTDVSVAGRVIWAWNGRKL